MKLLASFLSMALAFAALPAALACDPIVANNMTVLAHDIEVWNTVMVAWIQGEITQTEDAQKISTKLSLSLKMASLSFVEATIPLHDSDTENFVGIYGTLGSDVKRVTALIYEKTEVLIKAHVTTFLDETLPSIKSACDGFAETFSSKTSVTYVERIKQVTVSIDSSLEAAIQSFHSTHVTPTLPKDKDNHHMTRITMGASSDGSAFVKVSQEPGDLHSLAEAKTRGSANAYAGNGGKDVHANSEDASSAKVSTSGKGKAFGQTNERTHIDILAEGRKQANNKQANNDQDNNKQDKRSEAADDGFVYVRRANISKRLDVHPGTGNTGGVLPGSNTHTPPAAQGSGPWHGAASETGTQEKRSESDSMMYVRRTSDSQGQGNVPHKGGSYRHSGGDDSQGTGRSREPGSGHGRRSASATEIQEKRSEAADDSFVYVRRAFDAKSKANVPRKGKGIAGQPKLPAQNYGPGARHKSQASPRRGHGSASDTSTQEKRSESDSTVYVRRNNASQGQGKLPKGGSYGQPGPVHGRRSASTTEMQEKRYESKPVHVGRDM